MMIEFGVAAGTGLFDIGDGETLAPFFTLDRVQAMHVNADASTMVVAVGEFHAGSASMQPAFWAGVPGSTLTRIRGLRGRAETLLPDGRILCLRFQRTSPSRDLGHSGSSLWVWSPDGGMLTEIASAPGGVRAYAPAAEAGIVAFIAPVHEQANDLADDLRLRRAATALGQDGVLYEHTSARPDDPDVGKHPLRLLVSALAPQSEVADGVPVLLPSAPSGQFTGEFAISADARIMVAGVVVDKPGDGVRFRLVVARRDGGAYDQWCTVPNDEGFDLTGPLISPDGQLLVCRRTMVASPGVPPDRTLWLLDLEDPDLPGGPAGDTAGLWPESAAWSPEGRTVYFTADQAGHRPVFAVDLVTAATRQLTGEGHYSHLQVTDDGLYALHSSVVSPPTPVLIDTTSARDCVELWSPAIPLAVPGRVQDINTPAADGTQLRGWLCLPERAPDEPATPLLVWIHGGPLFSWNAWSWRWNPWLAVSRGYAVLLPDPALSTGYGRTFVQRGWTRWSAAPYDDVLRLTDEAGRHPKVNPELAAVMGPSFGGYLTNRLATRSQRFRAVVSHAGIWDMRHVAGASDVAWRWMREYGHPLSEAQHHSAETARADARDITVPILITHGGKDWHVPLSDALTFWNDLRHLGKDAKFLHFPTEGHGITRPANVQLWYQTVFAFLDTTLHGKAWIKPRQL